ncbi:MAG: ABC transporter permease [Candidatus Eisenbacteria bacterium]|uniref:ABC transporter permease n=1 Tax=Eiseniibacteriota bacterium TaxID=2212470 RepID=A0A849SHA7_UNCEI|nr:ABC transporter permease [Candidatus Eisenbacteria bacterium]
MAIPIEYNLRNILQRPVATLTTALGIALTVAILIGALALASGFQATLTSAGSPNNAIVLRKGADSEISSGVSREAAAILRAHPEVATRADGRPMASAEAVVILNRERLGQKGSSNLSVRGVDFSALDVRGGAKVVDGRMPTPGSYEVMVGRRIASRFANCRVGDKIRFGQRDFTVVGQFTAGGSAFESEIWGDAEVMIPALDRGNQFQSLVMRLKDPSHFGAFKREVEKDPRLQVQVKRESEFYAEQSGMLTNLLRFMGVFIVLIMGVGAVFGAMNTMFASVSARTREIATLMVLGFGSWSIMVSFMIESVVISLIGGAIGCLLALPINGITTSTTNFQSFSEVAFAFRVTPPALVVGLIFAGLMGLVGGFLPALRAARQPLSAALRKA